MTCIVGLAHGNTVWVGGDSAVTYAEGVVRHPDGKVFARGEFVLGCAGLVRGAEIVRHAFDPPPITGPNLDSYMHTTFVDALRRLFRESGFLTYNQGQERTETTLLVGVRGRLYGVSGNFNVYADTYPWLAQGDGAPQALGAMYATLGLLLDPEARLLLALEAAAHYTKTVRPPFTVICSPERVWVAEVQAGEDAAHPV
jgi:ATP-dependent protease HslVU (ClpYQ) peptidase subunit